jgi:transcriptional regulator with XRE-family HTH domain
MDDFARLLRTWRQNRGRTQQQLADDADVSTRHLSFIENGRAQPSRELVAVLVEALDVPSRDRNAWLVAAGFAPVYRETALDAATLGEARDALSLILQAYEPFPAICFDRNGDVRMANRACLTLAAALSVEAPGAEPYALFAEPRPNLVRLLLEHVGLRSCFANWNEVANAVVDRARRELIRSRDKTTRALLEAAVAQSGMTRIAHDASAAARLILPIELNIHGSVLRFFSTITTFGTAYDITLEELRVEALHPANAQTERAVRSGGGLGARPVVLDDGTA